jgi:F0F1-type ATP synthase assembly protein I
MVSISSLFRFVFIFSVLTVAGIGFLFDEMSFLRLAILNTVVLGFVWLIVRFMKTTPVVAHAPKNHKEEKEEILEEKVDEEDTSKKPSHHAHHQQFVKYTYHHKKKKNSLLVWILILLGLVGASYLAINRNLGSVDTKSNDDVLSGYAEDILSQKDDLSGAISSGTVIESTGEVLSTGSIQTAT